MIGISGCRMDLYIYNPSLQLIHVMDTYESFRWVRKYTDCGEFELHCPFTLKNIALLAKENIIRKQDSNEAAYISYRTIKQNDKGEESIVVKGKFLQGYLKRRIIWGNEILNTTVEAAIRTLIDKNGITPTVAQRIIPNLILGSLNNYTETVDYETAYKNLLEEITSLCTAYEYGQRIRLDSKNHKLIFELYKGLNRTSSQQHNPQCVFSKEFDNLLDYEYTDSIEDYKNVVLVGGKSDDDDSDRRFVTVGSGEGLDRFEVFNNQGGLSTKKDKVEMTTTEYDALLTEKGNTTLSQSKVAQSLSASINLRSNLKYRTDFDLGDIVTCKINKLGLKLDSRIMEIEEVYEETGLEVFIVFGDELPTLSKKIKLL